MPCTTMTVPRTRRKTKITKGCKRMREFKNPSSSQFSVLSSQFSVLSSQFSVLSSQFSVLRNWTLEISLRMGKSITLHFYQDEEALPSLAVKLELRRASIIPGDGCSG